MGNRKSGLTFAWILEFIKMKNSLLLLIAVAIALSSCREKNKVDVVPPLLNLVTIDGDDSTSVTLTAGENITIRVEMTDNMGLNELQFNIHPAENGHTHSADGHGGGEERLNSGVWFDDGRADVNGTSAVHEFQLTVPDDIAGNWHLSVNLLDEVGEKAIERIVLIKVENDNLPSLNITTIPALGADGNLTLVEGSELTVNGEAMDPDGLEYLYVFVVNSSGNTEDTTEILLIDNPTGQIFNGVGFDNFPEGEFRLIVEAIDTFNFVRKWDALIYVT